MCVLPPLFSYQCIIAWLQCQVFLSHGGMSVAHTASNRSQWIISHGETTLTLSMLRLLRPKHKDAKNLWKPSKPYHVGIHWIALVECFQMSTHLLGFQSFFRFLHHFVLAKLATSSIRVNSLHPWDFPWQVSSAGLTLLKITFEFSRNKQNVWRKILGQIIPNGHLFIRYIWKYALIWKILSVHYRHAVGYRNLAKCS